jgi:hypothetical protein
MTISDHLFTLKYIFMQTQLPLRQWLAIGACCLFLSCQKDIVQDDEQRVLSQAALKATAAGQVNTFKGPQVTVGHGKARSWISVNHEGMPIEIGIELTSKAVESLSEHDMFDEHIPFALPLHQKAMGLTPFEHIVVDWNPHGHPPASIFTVPHFDFHFYMIPEEEQLAIPPYPLAPAQHDLLPPTGYMPASYFPDPGGVPQMGKHWGNRSVAPGTFTHTMTLGSYNGEVTFVEPMVTVQGLETQVLNIPYAQPAIYQEHGVWYPTQYNIYKIGDKYYVSLSNFVWSD